MLKYIIIIIVATCYSVNCFAQDCISYSRSIYQTEKPQTFSSSGNSEFDQINIYEIQTLSSVFGVSCKLSYYRDDSPNCFYKPDENTIYIGLNMANEILEKYGSFKNVPGFKYGSVYPFVVAHEFGHAVSHLQQWNFKRGNSAVRNELFADFCAGAYACFQRTIINSASTTTFLGAFDISSIVDLFKSLGNWDFNNPDFHGTPQDRKIAVIEGYNFASNYIFNYRRYYHTNLVPQIDSNSLYSAALRMLNSMSY